MKITDIFAALGLAGAAALSAACADDPMGPNSVRAPSHDSRVVGVFVRNTSTEAVEVSVEYAGRTIPFVRLDPDATAYVPIEDDLLLHGVLARFKATGLRSERTLFSEYLWVWGGEDVGLSVSEGGISTGSGGLGDMNDCFEFCLY